jgi:hypothetical protein
MDEDGSTDGEGTVRRQPAASSSPQTSGPMTLEELRILRRIDERLRNFASIMRVKEVRKPNSSEMMVTLNVALMSANISFIVILRHTVDPISGKSSFISNSVPQTEWLNRQLSEFCSSNACKSLNCVFQRLIELVEERRLELLMNSLDISGRAMSSDEEGGSGESLSSGTTAASPQSSRSTTTSIP